MSSPQDLVETGLACWRDGEPAGTGMLIVRGQANLLEDLTAHGRPRACCAMLFDDAGDAARAWCDLLELARRGDRACSIFIGSDKQAVLQLSGCVDGGGARIRDSQDAASSARIGVIGPTRLNYARIVPMVDYTAKVLSRLIT